METKSRPRRIRTDKTYNYHCKVEPQLYRAARLRATLEGRSLADVIHDLLLTYVSYEKQPL